MKNIFKTIFSKKKTGKIQKLSQIIDENTKSNKDYKYCIFSSEVFELPNSFWDLKLTNDLESKKLLTKEDGTTVCLAEFKTIVFETDSSLEFYMEQARLSKEFPEKIFTSKGNDNDFPNRKSD